VSRAPSIRCRSRALPCGLASETTFSFAHSFALPARWAFVFRLRYLLRLGEHDSDGLFQVKRLPIDSRSGQARVHGRSTDHPRPCGSLQRNGRSGAGAAARPS